MNLIQPMIPTTQKDISRMQNNTSSGFFDVYSKSGLYSKRYPSPNLYTYKMIVARLEKHYVIYDVGCGNGRYLIPLLKNGYEHICGIDISPEMIKELKARIAQEKVTTSGLSVICDDFDNVELTKNSIDVFLCLFGTLAHIKPVAKRRRCLHKIFESLQPGGFFIGSVPNRFRRLYFPQCKRLLKSLFHRDTMNRKDIEYNRCFNGRKHTNYYYLFSLSELRNELANAGFESISFYGESIISESIDLRLNLSNIKWRPVLFCYDILFMCQKG